MTLSDDPVVLRGPCRTGEHTRRVLTELDFSAERIDELVRAGIAGEPVGSA